MSKKSFPISTFQQCSSIGEQLSRSNPLNVHMLKVLEQRSLRPNLLIRINSTFKYTTDRPAVS